MHTLLSPWASASLYSAVRVCVAGPHRPAKIVSRRQLLRGASLLAILFFVELALLLSGSVLVLLILGNEVVHVALGLGELHLVHALPCVPVQESLTPEHSGEILGNTLEHFLNSG